MPELITGIIKPVDAELMKRHFEFDPEHAAQDRLHGECLLSDDRHDPDLQTGP